MYDTLLSTGYLATIWIASGAMLVARGVQRRRDLVCAMRRLRGNERGGEYAISIVMIMPLYFVLLAFFIQSTLLLVNKLGTIYGAFAAARAAIVWVPTDVRADLVKDRIDQAAINASLPLASGDERFEPVGIRPIDPAQATTFAAVYRRFRTAFDEVPDGNNPLDSYIQAKWRSASQSVHVELFLDTAEGPKLESIDGLRRDAPAFADIHVIVSQQVPIIVPAMGPFFGKQTTGVRSQFYACEISSAVTLSLESSFAARAHSSAGASLLGVRYDTIH